MSGKPGPLAYAEILSLDFGVAAAFSAIRSKQIESDPPKSVRRKYLEHRTYVLNSVISSAAFLEGLVNDVFLEMSESSQDERSITFSNLWKLGIPRSAKYAILDKYQIALIIAGCRPFDTGASPFQEAALVVTLRNALLHYEAVMQPSEGLGELPTDLGVSQHNIVAKLRGKYPLNPLCSPHAAMWPTQLLSAGCAQWCFDVSVKFVDEFLNQFPVANVREGNKKILSKMMSLVRELSE